MPNVTKAASAEAGDAEEIAPSEMITFLIEQRGWTPERIGRECRVGLKYVLAWWQEGSRRALSSERRERLSEAHQRERRLALL